MSLGTSPALKLQINMNGLRDSNVPNIKEGAPVVEYVWDVGATKFVLLNLWNVTVYYEKHLKSKLELSIQ